MAGVEKLDIELDVVIVVVLLNDPLLLVLDIFSVRFEETSSVDVLDICFISDNSEVMVPEAPFVSISWIAVAQAVVVPICPFVFSSDGGRTTPDKRLETAFLRCMATTAGDLVFGVLCAGDVLPSEEVDEREDLMEEFVGVVRGA